MTRESEEDRGDLEGDASLPLIADPSTAALMGTAVVFVLLMPPTAIVVLVAIFLHWLARSRRRNRSSDVDPDFALRFHRLEDNILGDDEVSNQGEP